LKTRLIVFFLTATQCFLVGCNLRNPPQRQEPQDPFSTEQEPFATPDRRNNDRNNNDRNNNDRNNNDRNNNDRNNNDRNNNDRNNNDRNNNDRNNDRDNNDGNRGGNFDRDRRDDTDRDRDRNEDRDRDRGGQRGYEKKHGVQGSSTNKVHVTAHEHSVCPNQVSQLEKLIFS
jgi:DNA mismatch repair ATPase MutL